MPDVKFGQVFRLMEDFTGAALNKKQLAEQALEKYQAKNPAARVTLYEQPPAGKSLLLPGLPQYYLLTEKSLDTYLQLSQDIRAEVAAEAESQKEPQSCLNQKAKALAVALGDTLSQMWRTRLEKAMVPLLKKAQPLNVRAELGVREPELREGIDFFLPKKPKKEPK